ncbi:MAG TPA: hypothetical protein VFX91_06145 [Alcanivorax sp.]|nr:hypothetical protein [Alcanivorax sp.]
MKGVVGFGPALLLTLTIGATGCGGGGGSDGGGDPGGGSGPGDQSGDSLPVLEGLSGVATNNNWLFYTSNADGNSGLFGFNPMMPDNGVELIDEDAFLSASPYVFSTIAGADLSGAQMSNYRAHYLFYRSKEDRILAGSGQVIPAPDGFQRVSTSQSAVPDSPSQVSSEADTTNLLSIRYFFQYNLSQPLDTAVAYWTDDHWRQVRVGDDTSQAPLEFDPDHQVMVPLGDGTPNGWLVIDEGNGNQLIKVDMTLGSQGPVLDAGGAPVRGLAFAQTFADLGLEERLVVLTFEDPDTSDDQVPGSELWLYSQGDPGTIEPLLNSAGEKLTFKANLFGQGAALPSAEKLVVRDGTLYFAFHEQGLMDAIFAANPMLYRVDENGWSLEIDYSAAADASPLPILASPFLIDAGDRLIWLIGDELTSIDLSSMSEAVLYEGSISTPVPVSQGGWLFYNDDRDVDTAVAARTDGSRAIRLQNARWIGASSRGEGSALSRRTKSEIGEVFLVRDDGTVAAVSAAQPDAGMVTLGQLDPVPESVTMFGARPGPHQLMQVQYEGEDDRYEVIYVNTLEADSLTHLMPEPVDAVNAGALTRPVYGH